MELKTKRLRIISLSTEQMALLAEGQDKLDSALGLVPCGVMRDEHIRKAFAEMYKLCDDHPKDFLWYTNRQIVLKAENKSVGGIGFKLSGEDGEGLLYEKEKPASSWMAIYIILGMSTGMSIGTAIGNTAIGMCLGMSFGIAVGTVLDALDKKNRKK